jgi:serine/threonine protein kinase
LIVETKSKLADNTKRTDVEKESGTAKSGKPAWRLDGKEEEYFNLVSYLKTTGDVIFPIYEALYSRSAVSPQINAMQLGQKFTGKSGKDKISLYAPKVDERTLYHHLHKALSIPQQKLLIDDLLKGIKDFHEKNLSHLDIKPANLLIYRGLNNILRLKITDFGHSSATDRFISPNFGSPLYWPPEIVAHKPALHKDMEKEDMIAYALYRQNQMAPATEVQVKKAYDMWAVGICIFEIKYDRIPKSADLPLIEQDPLLKGLLDPDPDKRFSAEEALDALKSTINAAPHA